MNFENYGSDIAPPIKKQKSPQSSPMKSRSSSIDRYKEKGNNADGFLNHYKQYYKHYSKRHPNATMLTPNDDGVDEHKDGIPPSIISTIDSNEQINTNYNHSGNNEMKNGFSGLSIQTEGLPYDDHQRNRKKVLPRVVGLREKIRVPYGVDTRNIIKELFFLIKFYTC